MSTCGDTRNQQWRLPVAPRRRAAARLVVVAGSGRITGSVAEPGVCRVVVGVSDGASPMAVTSFGWEA